MKSGLKNKVGSAGWVVAGCLILSVALQVGCKGPHVDPSPGGDPSAEPVIDIHTHLFNARYLPMNGILKAHDVPDWIADTVADAIEWLTDDSDVKGLLPEPPAAGGTKGRTAAQLRWAEKLNGKAALSDEQRRRIEDYLGMNHATPLKDSSKMLRHDTELLARVLEKAKFLPPHEVMRRPSAGMKDASIAGYLGFMDVVTDSEASIARRLSREYPEVRLFVHHMMDMGKAYADTPDYAFEKQTGLMKRLDEKFGGQLLHFVAYDPFRRGQSLTNVQQGIDAGAVGVKFYPPSGYRAACNEIPSRQDSCRPEQWDSRYSDLKGGELDAFNEKLFTFCETNGIPILTHCTPGGFEADKKAHYGRMSDPAYWRTVLERHNNLRLCFGHAGGTNWWFSKSDSEPVGDAKFGRDAVDLCLKYPNVYCEVAFLDLILAPDQVPCFTQRLQNIINQPSQDGSWKLGDKLMYGTDWFMIYAMDGHENFLKQFQKVFATQGLADWRRAFFAGNAVRFLNLPKLAGDARFTQEQQQYWRKLCEQCVRKGAGGPARTR